MALKRKPVTDDVAASPSDDEGDSDFELGLLDDELSSDEDSDHSGDEAQSESGENSDDDAEEDDMFTSLLTNGKTNGRENGADGSESENLQPDASSEYYSS